MNPRYESGEKFLRVIQLFQRLSDTEAGLTTTQLADELEVTTRSVQRYIATLRDSVGIDIEDAGGRFRIGKQSRLPAMQLDHFQATALLVAVRLLYKMQADQDPALVGALAQLARTLRVPVVNRYLERIIAAAESRPHNLERWRIERTVIDGFVRRQAVAVSYRDAQGHDTQRVLHPYFLEPRPESRTIYVFAFDERSHEVRSLRLDRIFDARLLTQTFDTPEGFDIDLVTGHSWGIWQPDNGELDDVVLRFDADVARRVHEAAWHPGASLRDLAGGGVELGVQVASEVEMRPWVLGWGASVEVVAPESLRAFVAETMRRGTALYAS